MANAISKASALICHQCGEEFAKRRGGNKFCGKACWTASERDKRIAKRRASGLRVEGDTLPCVTCGDAVAIKRGQTKYCDPCRRSAGRGKAARWRHANPDREKEIQRRCDIKRKSRPDRIEQVRMLKRTGTAKRRAAPRHRLDHRVSQLVRNALGGAKSGRTWESLVGYSLDDLMVHLERQFVKGMGWHNIGDWHVDHIVPKSSFSYSSPEDDEFKACWALTNLRPLWAEENLKKSDQRTHLI